MTVFTEYKIKNDGTKFDKFVFKLTKYLQKNLPQISSKISVRGLAADIKPSTWGFYLSLKNSSLNKAINEWKGDVSIFPSLKIQKAAGQRFYELLLSISDPMTLNLELQGTMPFREFGIPTPEDELQRVQLIRRNTFRLVRLLKPFSLFNEITAISVHAFDKDSSWASKQRGHHHGNIRLGILLPVSAIDGLIHCCGGRLTEIAKQHFELTCNIIDTFLEKEAGLDATILYENCEKRSSIIRECENILRDKMNLPKIGEGFLKETQLANFTKKLYPDAIREFSAPWLKRQRIDIYIPFLKVAIEYNGEQHYRPVDFFGGEPAFKQTKRRDQLKRKRCIQNNVHLIEWKYDELIDLDSIKSRIESIFSEKSGRKSN